MNEKRKQEIKNEVAHQIIDACGSTGVLESVDNKKLNDDIKIRHQNAMNEARKFAGKKQQVDPSVQAIFARLYGLI